MHHLIFIVHVEDDDREFLKLLIKFTRQYGIEAHTYCAKLGIAPEVHGIETLAGGWKAVIMAYLDSDFVTLHKRTLDKQIVTAMREAARKMHEGGFVHGDLRDVNILYRHRQDIVDIAFVDWDWAGLAKEVKYPTLMNMEVPRHSGAVPHQFICREHDDYLLDTIESNAMMV